MLRAKPKLRPENSLQDNLFHFVVLKKVFTRLGARLAGGHSASCFIFPVSMAVMQYCIFVLSLLLTPTVILTRPTPVQTYSMISIRSKERWFLVPCLEGTFLTNQALFGGRTSRVCREHFRNRLIITQLQNAHPQTSRKKQGSADVPLATHSLTRR